MQSCKEKHRRCAEARKRQRAQESAEERELRLAKQRAQDAARRARRASLGTCTYGDDPAWSLQNALNSDDSASTTGGEESQSSQERWNAIRRQRRALETAEEREKRLEKERVRDAARQVKRCEERKRQRAEETEEMRAARLKKRCKSLAPAAGLIVQARDVEQQRRLDYARRVGECDSATREFHHRFTNHPFGNVCSVCNRLWHKNDLTPAQPVSRCCALPRCSSKTGPDVVLHPFPKVPLLRQAWISFVRQCPDGRGSDWIPLDGEESFLCSRHFDVKCFTHSSCTKCLGLQADAVPSLDAGEGCFLSNVMASSSITADADMSQDDASTQYIAQDAARSAELFNLSKLTQCPWVMKSTPTQTEQGFIEEKDSLTVLRKSESPSEQKSQARGRRYLCSDCSYGANFLYALKIHQRTHTGERPFQCIHCNKGFPIISKLTEHVRIHTGELPCQCIHCGKRFRVSSDLTKHIRIHTGERPHKCVHCSCSFSTRSTLTKHLRTHTGERPYHCNLCPRTFVTRDNLRIHENIHKKHSRIP